MPASPEIRGVLGHKGLAEVLRKLNAQHLGAADDDVDAAGKFHIQLNGIGHGAQNDHDAVHAVVVVIDAGDHAGQTVRHHHLFKEAQQDPEKAGGDPVYVQGFSLPQLHGRILVGGDGAFHDLGEEQDKEGQTEGIVVRLDLFPVHIHQIAYGLQGIEGNADGEEGPGGNLQTYPAQGQETSDVLQGKVQILRHEKDRKNDQDAENKDPLRSLFRLLLKLLFSRLVQGRELFLRFLPYPFHADAALPDQDRQRYGDHDPFAVGQEKEAAEK